MIAEIFDCALIGLSFLLGCIRFPLGFSFQLVEFVQNKGHMIFDFFFRAFPVDAASPPGAFLELLDLEVVFVQFFLELLNLVFQVEDIELKILILVS